MSDLEYPDEVRAEWYHRVQLGEAITVSEVAAEMAAPPTPVEPSEPPAEEPPAEEDPADLQLDPEEQAEIEAAVLAAKQRRAAARKAGR